MTPAGRPKLIIVNGYPGSGKTTFAKRLAGDLLLPLLGKDALKEWMYEELGLGLPSEVLGRMASEMLYAAAAEAAGTGHSLLIESAFHREFAGPKLKELVDKYGLEVLEVYMEVDPQTAHDRLRDRLSRGDRHAVHDKDASAGDSFDESWAGRYDVIGIGQVERYDAKTFNEAEYQRVKSNIKIFLEG